MIDTAALRAGILREVAARVNSRLPQAVGPIRSRLTDAVRSAIEASPEYVSLRGGKLQGELGVLDPQGAVESIVLGIVGAAELTLRPVTVVGNLLLGGMSLKMLRDDLADVLDSAGGSFRSEGGYDIDWLKWLLTAGDSVIVIEYEFFPGPSPHSRTGLGVMRRGTTGWRVPPEFAGKPGDNWLTRALRRLEPQLEAILAQEIGRVM